MMQTTTAALGRVITFYSYKGGTGRSMALANAAWVLAANGQRVLAIDWDLEAPGLQRYFQPYLRDPKLEASDGLMDFVLAFAEAARSPTAEARANSNDSNGDEWFERYADLRMFAYSVNWSGFADRGGRLDFVPAGRQDAGYSLRVNSFNWQHFYTKLGGGIFLEAVKRRLRAEYDYVLIDSRTGVSDTSGVCTVQMPDTLVVCFTLNEQSIHGAAGTAASALEQRRTATGASTLRVMPVPTRVDSSEKERVDAARAVARERFNRFLDWIDEDQLDTYWADVETPYIPFYSLEEVLAVFDRPRVRTSLLPAVEGLVSWLSEQRITELPLLEEHERKKEMERFLRSANVRGARGIGNNRLTDTVFFVNFARRDGDNTLFTFLQDLSAEVASLTGLPSERAMFLDQYIRDSDTNWPQIYKEAVGLSDAVLCIVSPGFLNSEQSGEELMFARALGKAIWLIEWVPVADKLPSNLQDLVLHQAPGRGGYRYLARESKGEAYRSALYDLANQIARNWRSRAPVTPTTQPTSQTTVEQIEIIVSIVAERSGAMRLAFPKATNYGLRRKDWVPFPRDLEQSVGDTVLAIAGELGLRVNFISLHWFRDLLSKNAYANPALVIIDALTAERPDYEKQLLEWDRMAPKRARAIVCVPSHELLSMYSERYHARSSGRIPIDVVATASEYRRALLLALEGLSRPTAS